MDCIEYFFESYQYTFSAIGAIGTMLAVIVSLWLVFRQHKSKIEASIQKAVNHQGFMVMDDLYAPIDENEMITIIIKNIGLSQVIIPYQFQFIEMPFCKYNEEYHYHLGLGKFFGKFLFLPVCTTTMAAFHIPERHKRKFPIKIEPKNSEVLIVSDKNKLKNSLISFNKFQRYLMRWKVMTTDGVFNGKISKSLKQEIMSYQTK